jgi:ABC-type bacteriocin/lantibiotic exporter with double-glycine peptidase domain
MYLAFQAFASAFFKPLSEVLNTGEMIGRFERRLKGLYRDLSVENTGDEDRLPEQTEKLRGHIRMKNVNFKYENGGFELRDINLEVLPGKRVAVLGDSGAGKTTLLKLLQGMYTPDSGEITIGGANPSHMDGGLFAESVGCANQEITVFSASVRDNITLWDDNISDAEVYNAASDACIHSYIAKLSGAYEYCLTEHGNNISGGQKQRLELARAFLRNPSVILLDEATGAIDPENRVTIEKNIIKRGCACVAVTHVLSQISDYDEIIILQKGKIAARGTHENLLQMSGFYASLFKEEAE